MTTRVVSILPLIPGSDPLNDKVDTYLRGPCLFLNRGIDIMLDLRPRAIFV